VTPWPRADLVRLAIGVVTGGVVVALAWNGAATRSQLDDQTQYIVLGVAGFLVAVVAQSLWLKRGRRAVALYAAAVQTTVASFVAEEPPTGPSVVASSEGLVAAGDMRHFHRRDCPIAAGRGWSAESRAAHEAAGRTPCGLCFRGTPPDPRGTP
jgi:peptidoglycan/LPS O-acetylase OafA/YrhL